LCHSARSSGTTHQKKRDENGPVVRAPCRVRFVHTRARDRVYTTGVYYAFRVDHPPLPEHRVASNLYLFSVAPKPASHRHPRSSQFKNIYFIEMCSGSDAGSYLRLIAFVLLSSKLGQDRNIRLSGFEYQVPCLGFQVSCFFGFQISGLGDAHPIPRG
jgi:hypothetical protein